MHCTGAKQVPFTSSSECLLLFTNLYELLFDSSYVLQAVSGLGSKVMYYMICLVSCHFVSTNRGKTDLSLMEINVILKVAAT